MVSVTLSELIARVTVLLIGVPSDAEEATAPAASACGAVVWVVVGLAVLVVVDC